jgi:multidrug efflux pump subunit AcrA (membrane-fusion protein)
VAADRAISLTRREEAMSRKRKAEKLQVVSPPPPKTRALPSQEELDFDASEAARKAEQHATVAARRAPLSATRAARGLKRVKNPTKGAQRGQKISRARFNSGADRRGSVVKKQKPKPKRRSSIKTQQAKLAAQEEADKRDALRLVEKMKELRLMREKGEKFTDKETELWAEMIRRGLTGEVGPSAPKTVLSFSGLSDEAWWNSQPGFQEIATRETYVRVQYQKGNYEMMSFAMRHLADQMKREGRL